jgi:uncharacterized sulfatase
MCNRRFLFLALCCALPLAAQAAPDATAGAAPASRPNILWLTSEDNGPHLGCYGDAFARTPHLDKLAAGGMRFERCWSVAPVCAPARTAIISGMYPSSTGSEHMRSSVPMPQGLKMFPQYLRDAGYYCTNNAKEDYNLEKPGKVWDESSKNAHWRNRRPGQPFFAVFNHEQTHESQCRKRPHTFVHQAADVKVPAYHPDCQEVRESWAQYYDQMTEMDAAVGRRLQELEADGLSQDTIVFYFGDHGPGLARGKRYPGDSGLRVPLIVHFPDKWKHLAPEHYAAGGCSKRLVSFVDLAPTLLSLAGIAPPAHLHGAAFAGPHAAPAREFLFGLRGRMDERYDLTRSATDGRYVYLRNFMPHKPWGQHVSYMFETPMTVAWQRLSQKGGLPEHLNYFWQTKAPEELYDLQSDPFETKNLAASTAPEHRAALERMRNASRQHQLRIRDVDMLPEAEMLARSKNSSPHDFARDSTAYPLEKILTQAELASGLSADATSALVSGLKDAEAGVRYWSAMGLLMRGEQCVRDHEEKLLPLLADASDSVRVASAEALAKFGQAAVVAKALDVLVPAADINKNPYYAAVAALNALDGLDLTAQNRRDAIKALPRTLNKGSGEANGRTGDYGQRLLKHILGGE